MTTRYTKHFLFTAALLLGAAQNVSADFADDALFSDERPSFAGLFQALKPKVAEVRKKATQPVDETKHKENLFAADISDIQPLHRNDRLDIRLSDTPNFAASTKDFIKQKASNGLKHAQNAIGTAGHFIADNAPAAFDHTKNALGAAGHFVTDNAPAALDHTKNALSAAGRAVVEGSQGAYAYLTRPVESEETEGKLFAAEQDVNLSLKPNPLPEVEGPTMFEKAGDSLRSAKDAVVTGVQNVRARLTQPTQMEEAPDSNIFAAEPGFENAVSKENIFSSIQMPEVLSTVTNLFSTPTSTNNLFDVDTQDLANLSLKADPLPQTLAVDQSTGVARAHTTTQRPKARTHYQSHITKSTLDYQQLRKQSRI
ncbi:MAG: hypothetical protein ACPG7U_02295 [Holosporaceae bacterium]